MIKLNIAKSYESSLAQIRNGLLELLSSRVLSLLSWNELYVRCAGKNDVDIQLLKQHTSYEYMVFRWFHSHVVDIKKVIRSFNGSGRPFLPSRMQKNTLYGFSVVGEECSLFALFGVESDCQWQSPGLRPSKSVEWRSLILKRVICICQRPKLVSLKYIVQNMFISSCLFLLILLMKCCIPSFEQWLLRFLMKFNYCNCVAFFCFVIWTRVQC